MLIHALDAVFERLLYAEDGRVALHRLLKPHAHLRRHQLTLGVPQLFFFIFFMFVFFFVQYPKLSHRMKPMPRYLHEEKTGGGHNYGPRALPTQRRAAFLNTKEPQK